MTEHVLPFTGGVGGATFRMSSDNLHRLFYNSLQFDGNSTKAFLYVPQSKGLYMNTSDGQVYIEDCAFGCEWESGEETVFLIDGKNAKFVEEFLRKAVGELQVNILSDGHLVLNADRPEGNPEEQKAWVSISYGEWVAQSELFEEEGHENGSLTFAINPDRLRKLSLLQPRDYPVDIKIRRLFETGQDVLLFKKGPRLRGVYGTLDYDLIQEEGNEHLW